MWSCVCSVLLHHTLSKCFLSHPYKALRVNLADRRFPYFLLNWISSHALHLSLTNNVLFLTCPLSDSCIIIIISAAFPKPSSLLHPSHSLNSWLIFHPLFNLTLILQFIFLFPHVLLPIQPCKLFPLLCLVTLCLIGSPGNLLTFIYPFASVTDHLSYHFPAFY